MLSRSLETSVCLDNYGLDPTWYYTTPGLAWDAALKRKKVECGMVILDLSKTLMCDFHYNYIKEKYGDLTKLLFTDTDSLMYEIETEDFYKDIAEDVEHKFDSSNYPKAHISDIPTGMNKVDKVR